MKNPVAEAAAPLRLSIVDLGIFEAMPGNSMLLALDAPVFTILAVTAGMVEQSGLKKSSLINKPFFDPFPATNLHPGDPNPEGQNILLNSFEFVLSEKAPHDVPLLRYDLANKDGEFCECYWRIYNKPVLDATGNVLYILHTSEDISAKVKAEARDERIRRIEREHKVFTQAPLAIQLYKGPELIIELANEPTFTTWGKEPDVIGKRLQDVLPELSSQGYIDLLHRVRESGEGYEGYEVPVMLHAGNGEERRYLNLVCQPYFETTTARATGVLSFFSDVTDKVLASQALKESNERFEAAIEGIQGILWTNSAEGKMIGEQKGWARLTGQSFNEYQDYGWATAVHPEDAQPTIEAWNEAVAEKKTFVYEHRVRKAEGDWGIFSIRAIPLLRDDGSIREWVGVHTEITEQRRAEKTIKESEQRFRNLADESPMFVFIIEPGAEASVSYWNQTWLRYTGQSMTEALGRAWNGIIHPDDVPVVIEHYTTAFQHRQAYFIPAIRVKRHDDKYRWHAFKGNPRYSPGGEFNGYVGVGFDIHEQKLAEEALKQSEERTRLAVDAARLGTYEINLAEQTIIYTARAAEIFGLDPAHHWNYKVFTDAVYAEDLPIRNRAHVRARETGELLYETRIVLPDGTLRFIRLNGKYLYKDATQFLIGTVIDITEEKRSAELLEQMIEERTRELRQVNDQLKQFTYSASHDLQEPLRKISFFLDQLLVNLGPTLNEDNRKIAERVQQTTGRMRMLIDDLLAYSNTTLGVTSFSEVDLNDTIKSVVDDMEVTVNEKGAKVNVEPLPLVKGDQRQLRQLFQNLISNALKYHKKNVPPQVYISSRFVTEADIQINFAQEIAKYDFYEIQIRDNGIGFEPDDAERIFRLFHRLHGRSEYEGTGIGLAIVQKVVENHRGHIHAEAVPGEGAVFKIYLPVSY